MNLIKKIKLRNFRGFREESVFDFLQLSYVIGVNNAGKTNILQGVKAFFDNSSFVDELFLNRTEFLAKKAGSNRSEITLDFDLNSLTTKTRKKLLIRKYGEILSITKAVTFTPDSGAVSISWKVGGDLMPNLPDDIAWLINSIKITYIHPQEGKQLLVNVQKRLRQRLLANWGRGAALTHNIENLQEQWAEMRTAANKYLSQSLSESLKKFWPDSNATVNIPKSIKDIIDISDINLQGYKDAPEIHLTSQGTGAQSTVLYLAHYLLDSDRTLNRGEYHPIWLMEEPESFLHADLLAKLSAEIHSQSWLKNIQMVISTHSPILLASSRIMEKTVVWNIIDNHKVRDSFAPISADENKIKQIGILMGDPNFYAYFTVSQSGTLIFTEDKRKETCAAFDRIGLPITKGLNGVTDIARYLDIFEATPSLVNASAYFIVDGDNGKDQIQRHIKRSDDISIRDGFKKMKLGHIPNVFLIFLPDGKTSEDLFDEYDNHLKDVIYEIWNKDFSLKRRIPTYLSRVVDCARRNSNSVHNEEDAVAIIKNLQDVKDSFWKKVTTRGYDISKSNMDIMRGLIV